MNYQRERKGLSFHDYGISTSQEFAKKGAGSSQIWFQSDDSEVLADN